MKIVNFTDRAGKVINVVSDNISTLEEDVSGTIIVMNSGKRYAVDMELQRVKARIAHQNAAEDVC